MRQPKMNLTDFQSLFATEVACVEHLFSLRWPDGYVCPRCGHRRYCFHGVRNLYQCSKCKYQVSVTAGTVFHKTRTPLRKWFWMIFLMTRQKSGVSMMSLQRMLDIKSYKTVWTMGHKIRKAMADREAQNSLGGLLSSEMNFAEREQLVRDDLRSDSRPETVAPVEVDERALGTTEYQKVGAISAAEMKDTSNIGGERSAALRTTGAKIYQVIVGDGLDNTRLLAGLDGNPRKRLPWIQVLLATIKGNLRGVHHGVSKKHLKRYINEYVYRFNRRSCESQLFNRAVQACASTTTVTFAELKV